MDDELIEKVRCALLLVLASDSKSHSVDNLARAAIQAVREAGWKSPDEIDSLESAAYDRGYEAGFPEPY